MKQPISYTDAEIEQIRNDTGPLSTHFKLDEQAGCKITELKEGKWVDGLPPIGTVCMGRRTKSGGGKMHECEVIYHKNKMGAVVFQDMQELQWCVEFRPILTPKQRTIEAAVESIKSTLDDSAEYLSANIIHTIALELSLDKLLTLPGESNEH